MATAATAGKTYTLDEYLGFCESSEEPHELVRGRLVVLNAPKKAHLIAQSCLVEQLVPHISQHGLGRLFTNGHVFVPDELATARRPDAIYLTGDWMSRLESQGFATAPDLVVEIISPGAENVRRDRVEKMIEYARVGVPHYWILDPEAETFEAYALEGGVYRPTYLGRPGDQYEPPLFPGLVLEIGKLFPWVAAR